MGVRFGVGGGGGGVEGDGNDCGVTCVGRVDNPHPVPCIRLVTWCLKCL